MNATLPSPIARYFTAANAHDTDAIAAAFAEDAIVFDEGQEHRGRSAIEAWSDDVNEKYQPVAEVTGFAHVDGLPVVTATVSGTFPGSPTAIRFHFTLSGEQIATLRTEA